LIPSRNVTLMILALQPIQGQMIRNVGALAGKNNNCCRVHCFFSFFHIMFVYSQLWEYLLIVISA
jgi:hypothetical protein